MKTGIANTVELPSEVELMTLLYKETYDHLWNKMPKSSQDMILEDPLGRRAKEFAHEVAKQAEIKRANMLDDQEEEL